MFDKYKPDLTLYVAGGLIGNAANSAVALGGANGTVVPGEIAKSFITGWRYVF